MMEKELRKIFEDTTTRNVEAILDHNNETRRMVNELKAIMVAVEGKIQSNNQDITEIKRQLAKIQSIIFRGGTNV